MNAANPIIRRLDHIVFRTESPESLFPLLADTFQLPVIWKVETHDFFTSGVVFAGNVYLEMMRFGNAKVSVPAESTEAEIQGLAFEPYRLRDSLDELQRRKIPHSPPFYSIGQRIDGEQGKAFTSITLGKLLSDRRNFYLGSWFGGNSPVNWTLGEITSKMLTFTWAGAVVSRAMDDTMIYVCEYTHDNDALRAAKSDELKSRGGGTLGFEYVQEVVLGVKNPEQKESNWQNFLHPIPPSASAAWQLPENGPLIRLVPAAQNIIKSLVLKVTSLEKAKSFLAERELLDTNRSEQVCIEPAKIQGLDICLVE